MNADLRLGKIQKIKGTVIEALPNVQFLVDIGDEKRMRCYLTGKMKMNKIKVMMGDKVEIELPKDITHIENYIGRIVFRYK